MTAKAENGPKYFEPSTEFAKGNIFSKGDVNTASGLAAFFNVDVGETTITAKADGHTCTVGTTGLKVSDNVIKGPIEAGRVTYFIFVCEKN